MIQFAAVASLLPELVGLLSDVVKSPETYEKLEAVRQLLSKLTGQEIDRNGLVGLLEGVTQGEPYTGVWVECNDDPNDPTRMMRFGGGWLVDIGRGNPVLIRDE